MIVRYSRPEMTRIWSDEKRLGILLEVETVFLEILAKDKGIPAKEIRALRVLPRSKLLAEVCRRERRSGHEIVALLGAIADSLGRRAPGIIRYLHYGLTSSDLLDTAMALQCRASADLLIQAWSELASELKGLARRHEDTWMAGRTHGVHAEPMTFGIKLAGWHAEALRVLARLRAAREAISYGKLSGAVGTFAHLKTDYEAQVCRRLGLKPEPVSTQVVPRDRHAEYFHALVLAAAALERFATEIRHLQKTEVLELSEPFGDDQKGSSAMPHKKNPVLCENLCGLSRLIRSYEHAVVENITLWHERDISHSSVERVAFPDAAVLLDFMTARFLGVLRGLKVDSERMKANLAGSLGLVFSQTVLLRLIDAGMGRLEAYDLVQKNAMKTWESKVAFRKVLESDPELLKRLSPGQLAACFDLSAIKTPLRTLLKRGGVY